MFEWVRGSGYRVRGQRALRTASLVPCTLALLSASGCTTVVDTVAAVFGPGEVGGVVDARVYPGMGHTVNRDEIDAVRQMLGRS